MRKFTHFMLLLACGLFALPAAVNAQVWAPQDSIIEEGYYRLHIIGGGRDSVMYTGDLGTASSTYYGYTGLMVKSAALVGPNDLDAIYKITRGGDKNGSPTWHLRNCREDGLAWFFPNKTMIGQSTYIFSIGEERDSVYLRTQDWGSSASIGEGTRVGSLTRKDVPSDGAVFIVPTCNVWRFRLGANSLMKINSYDSRAYASFFLEKVDMTGREAWMLLNEAIADARGLGYGVEAGDALGQVTSQTALDAFNKVIDQAVSLSEEGAANDELYNNKTAEVRDAITEIKKYAVQLSDAYVAIANHGRSASWPAGMSKWMAPFNDFSTRAGLSGSGTLSSDGQAEVTYMNSSKYYPCWYLGYLEVADGTTSNLPWHYIWHIKPAADGNFTMKNCGESGVWTDSTYFIPMVPGDPNLTATTTNSGRSLTTDVWSQFGMVGTPRRTVSLKHIQTNQYWIWLQDNPYFMNMGVQHFNTANPMNAMTYACWEFYTVPADRITPKFKLNEAITDAAGVFIDWTPGVSPGQLKLSVAEPLQKALADARAVYAKEGASDADYTAAEAALREVYNATWEQLKDTANVLNPMEEGYYHIVGTSYQFSYRQGDSRYVDTADFTIKQNWYADEENILKWQLYQDRTNPNELWKISKMDDGKWSIQNVGTGRYVDGVAATNTKIPMIQEPSPQTLTQDTPGNYGNYSRWKTNGYWNIFGPYNDKYPHYLYQHQDGLGTGSYCTEWQTYWNAWHFLEKETDIQLIDSLVAVGAQKARNTEVLTALDEAVNAKDRTVAYTFNNTDSLLYEAGAVYGLKDVDGNDSIGYDITKNQFSSNNKAWNEGTYRSLIDGDPGTYFHTRYSAAGGPQITNYSYLQVDLRDKPQKSFCFRLNLRGESNPYYGNYGGMPTTYGRTDYGQNYRPLEIVVYGANDTIEGTEWTEVKHIQGIPTHQNFRTYWSPLIESETAYRYYRFEVPNTFGNNQWYGFPTWCFGDFQVYPAVANSAKSSSVYDAATKAAVDALDALVAQAKTEQAAEKVTQETLDALYAAVAKVNEVAPDSMQLVGRILDAQVLADSSYVEDNVADQQYGDVTAAQKSVLEAAIAKAKSVIGTNFSQADLDAAYNELDAAFWTLN
ncbi:MAG: hypothetical protein ILA34_02170, partial [Bacteroidaceae bacterium]|nr:hypothetical protein [Bacteroidaceae bacterium]